MAGTAGVVWTTSREIGQLIAQCDERRQALEKEAAEVRALEAQAAARRRDLDARQAEFQRFQEDTQRKLQGLVGPSDAHQMRGPQTLVQFLGKAEAKDYAYLLSGGVGCQALQTVQVPPRGVWLIPEGWPRDREHEIAVLALYGVKTRLSARVGDRKVDLYKVKLGSGFVQRFRKKSRLCFRLREGGGAAGEPLELVFASGQRPDQAFKAARAALKELNVHSGPPEVVYIELFFLQDPDLAQSDTGKRKFNSTTHEEKFRIVLSKLEAFVKTKCERAGVKFGPPFGWTKNGLTCDNVELKKVSKDSQKETWIPMRDLLDLMKTPYLTRESRGITETAFVDSGLCGSIDGIVGDGAFLQLEQVCQGVEHLFDEEGVNLVRIKKDSYEVRGFE